MLRICQSDQREWEGPTIIPISDIDDGKVCRMARRGRGPVRLGIRPLPLTLAGRKSGPYPPWPPTPPANIGSLGTVWSVVTSSS